MKTDVALPQFAGVLIVDKQQANYVRNQFLLGVMKEPRCVYSPSFVNNSCYCGNRFVISPIRTEIQNGRPVSLFFCTFRYNILSLLQSIIDNNIHVREVR